VQGGEGDCTLVVDSAAGQERIALRPATLVIRLWRSGSSMIVRGSISLEGASIVAPIQSNANLEQLLRAWLFDSAGSSGNRR
jgi:hypothetical protein